MSHRREVCSLLHLSKHCFTTPNKIVGAVDAMVITVNLKTNAVSHGGFKLKSNISDIFFTCLDAICHFNLNKK